MRIFKKVIYYFIIILSVVVILLSLLSLIHDVPYWYSKVLDFPRQQYLLLGMLCVLLFIWLNKKWNPAAILLSLGLISSIGIHCTRILPYVIGEKTVPRATLETVTEENVVGIMIANVLISNRKADDFLKIVNETAPDLLLVMEVNQWWVDELQALTQQYPYIMKYPADNAYGMALYSKLPLKNKEIKFLKKPDVPSFHTQVMLTSGKVFKFHGVHPVAPVPSDKYPDNVDEEEVALLKVGKMVAEEALPSVVAGDYNDVSWSYTSRLFENNGNLNNVRIGRGLFNSFDARSYIMRWPLDHCFVSNEFSLLELMRLPDFGSDHFPLYVKLAMQN